MATGERPESITDLIKVLRISEIPRPDGDTGEGIKFLTNRGELKGIVHGAENSTRAVVWVCGARGGFGGPGPGTYARLSEQLTGQGITSLRLDYRFPNDLMEWRPRPSGRRGVSQGDRPRACRGGGSLLRRSGRYRRRRHQRPHQGRRLAVAADLRAGMAGQLAPRKLLVAHGKADTRLPFSCRLQIYEWAKEPKEVVLFEGPSIALKNAAKSWRRCFPPGFPPP